MDAIFQEKLNELLQRWLSLKEQMDALQTDIENLKAEAQAVPEPVAEPEPVVEPEPVAEPAPVPEPVPATPEIESIDLSLEDFTAAGPAAEPEEQPDNLFGDASEITAEEIVPRRKRGARAVYETATGGSRAVVDAMAAKAAWRIDMPGPEVRSLRSAIALGDQVVFINRLFRKDSALYQSTIDALNNMSTLSEAVHYLSETFPEWDLDSDDVYRFMMAVRRKVRK
ncbi:MAG: hypothetical protein IJS75_01760 [Bacteroidales bacterium]|nr:hypothetical protein [Bacteroidales bacterium]